MVTPKGLRSRRIKSGCPLPEREQLAAVPVIRSGGEYQREEPCRRFGVEEKLRHRESYDDESDRDAQNGFGDAGNHWPYRISERLKRRH